MNNKEKYRQLCLPETSIPIFSRDWWLDAVCGNDNWDVALIEKGGEVFASMPYFIKKKYGFKLLTMPPLTPFLGPWMRLGTGKYVKDLSRQNELMSELIEQLPAYDVFRQSWHYNITNWLPFYWRGFQQTSHYTYVIENISDMESGWNNFYSGLRTQIRKAVKNSIRVRDDGSIEDIIELNNAVYKRQGIVPFVRNDVIRRLDEVCALRSCRKIFIAEDEAGNRHSTLFIVWDDKSAYYLMGGKEPSFPNSGAGPLAFWEAIKFTSTVSKRFDFEGSMIQSIGRFFGSFGAVQKPVFCISKTDSILLHTAIKARDILGTIRNKYDHGKHKTR